MLGLVPLWTRPPHPPAPRSRATLTLRTSICKCWFPGSPLHLWHSWGRKGADRKDLFVFPGPAGCGQQKRCGEQRPRLGTFMQRRADGPAWSCPECGRAQAPANSCPQTHPQHQRRDARVPGAPAAGGSVCSGRAARLCLVNRPPWANEVPGLGNAASPGERLAPRTVSVSSLAANRGENCFTHPSPLPPRCRPRGPQPGWLVSGSEALSGLRRGGGLCHLCFGRRGRPARCRAPAAGWGPGAQRLHYAPSLRRNPVNWRLGHSFFTRGVGGSEMASDLPETPWSVRPL